MKTNKIGKLLTDKKGRIIVPKRFDLIYTKELLVGDILLFYHGNKLTELHGRYRRKKFDRVTLPPYHAAIVYLPTKAGAIILDPELRTTLSSIGEYTKKKSIRIDVIRYSANQEQRDKIQEAILDIAEKENYYDIKGYGFFLSQMPFFSWVGKFIKPSKNLFFCSDAVAYCCKAGGIKVSVRGHNKTAPLDLLIYGMKNHEVSTLKNRGELIK